MKKTFFVIAVLVVSIAVVATAYAFQSDERPGSHKEFGFKKYLGLSDEQLAKMKELRDSFRNDTRDLRYNLAIKRLEMRKLFTDPKTDDATLLAKQKEISKLRQQLSDKKAAKKIAWRGILTPEQIAKLDRMPHKRHTKGWAHHRHHDGQCTSNG
ncbi:MAG TPA: Spy/CpxP family protein refolding chaperone [Nitrospirota bacterium]|nr:Spy/CpxP family protein refolding chaperone [Nitrospirota bacterium]